MLLMSKLKKYIPVKFKKRIKSFLFPSYYRKARRSYKFQLENIKRKEKIKVAFFLIHESVWKYDQLYRLMEHDERFEPVVIVCPYVSYGWDVMIRDMESAYEGAKKKGFNALKAYNKVSGKWMNVKKSINPDIVFFTNPWDLTYAEFRIENYLDRLTCYVPYGFKNSNLYEAHFNQPMHNLTWRFFVETPIHKNLAKKYSKNNAENVVVTGFPGLDGLLLNKEPDENSQWKIEDRKVKRIIWSPHHTIPGYGANLDYSTFLQISDFMLEMAIKYRDQVQIALKPHPLLRTKLSLEDVWGAERTEVYFNKWRDLENGSLVEGDYIGLFQTSDALINDSSSFVIEYLYTGNPMLFLLEEEGVLEKFNEVGKRAIELSYLSRSKQQIEDFIANVVIDEKDPNKESRLEYFQSFIKPPNNASASENIFTHIKNTIT